MKKLFVIAVCASLAACGGNEADDTTVAPQEPITEAPAADPALANAAGTYEMTAPDGTVMMRNVNADGTYSTQTDGTAGETGMVRLDGEAMCYDPEGPDPESCWTAGEVAADGSFEVTDGVGGTMTVRRTD